MTGISAPRVGAAKPPSGAISVALFVLATAGTAYLRLSVYRSDFVTLSYSLPLLICFWQRDLRLLWAMSASFIAIATAKMFVVLPRYGTADPLHPAYWAMHVLNVLVVAVVVQAVLVLRGKLEARNIELQKLNEELAAREREIAHQNEELIAQAEELRQQNEELQSQGEELARQNEELQQQAELLSEQAEELQTLSEEQQQTNRELDQRESMLQAILGSLRGAHTESQVLARVCEALTRLAGESCAGAALLIKDGAEMVVKNHSGFTKLERERWPVESSFAQIVMQTGKTGFVDDLQKRPDIIIPSSAGAVFRSVLASPLTMNGVSVGTVEVYSVAPRLWTGQDFRVVEWVAAQSAIVMETLRLQDESRRQAQLLDTITAATPNLIYVKDENSRFVYCSPGLLKLSGQPLHALVGRRDTDWLESAKEGEALLANDRQVFEHGQTLAFDETMTIKGVTRVFLTTKSPLRDGSGRIVGLVGVSRDFTERRAQEQVLQATKDQLVRANEELEQVVFERTEKLRELVSDLEHFSYSITHDMRAPLRAMRGFAEILVEQSGPALSPEGQSYLSRIVSAAHRMDRLITDALNYSTAVKQQLPVHPINVRHLLQGMIDSYPIFQQPNADVAIEGELPEVVANEAGLTQCFSNLLGNAVKFVPKGKQPKVRISAVQKDGTVKLFVEDNGIGIPDSALHSIFGMFQRATRSYEGTGIGLALVKKVVERMGGEVGVESTEGVGSRFWLELKGVPAKRVQPGSMEAVAS